MDGNKSSGEGKTFFESVESSYYSFCDSLQEKGIKIYDWFVNPLEDRGIPSLPAFAIILLLLLLGAGWLAFGGVATQAQDSYELSVSVSNEKGGVDGAMVSLFKGGSLVSKEKTKGGIALFESLEQGEYSLEVQKEGFQNATQNVLVPDQKYLEITLKSGASPRVQPNGKTTPESVTFANIDFPSSGNLVLHVFVNGPNGESLDAVATMYDARNNVKLGTIQVKNGWATFEGVEEGMSVYADASAEGFAPYPGSANAITISKDGINSITITLSRLTGDFTETPVKITDLQDNPLSGVSVQVFPAGSATPLTLYNSLTDSKGVLVLLLDSKNGSRYKLLASKAGFDEMESDFFKAGDPIAVRLHKPGEYTDDEKERSSTVNALVTQDGAAVKNAIVALSGAGLVTRTRNTDAQGKASFFLFGKRGQEILASASKGNRFASQTLSLGSAEVSVELKLEAQKASVIVNAIRYSSQEPLDASFEASVNNQPVSSCATNLANTECELEIPMGVTAQITASAQGFVSETHDLVINAPQLAKTFSLVSESEVQSSQIKDFRVTLEASNEPVEIMYPGKRYEAKFTLLGKTEAASDSFGFYFSVDPSRAVIRKFTPPSAPPKTLGSPSSACSPTQVNYANANAVWVDVTYAGSANPVSKNVRIVFEVKPLREGVLEEQTLLKYRSFLVQQGKYYRNPLNSNDAPETRFDPKTPLASGCNSPTIDRAYSVNSIGVTCSGFACIQVAFTQQGAQSAKDNFVANKAGANPAPVIMAFEITMRKAQLEGELGMSFSAPGGFLGLLSAKYPGEPDAQGTPPESPETISFNGTQSEFSVSLNHLRSYANFGVGFAFAGQIALSPLAKTAEARLFLQIADAQSGVRHYSSYSVSPNESIGGGGGGVSFEHISLLPPSNDSCGSAPVVAYDPAERNQILVKARADVQAQCGTIEMRSSPVFPADAIKVNVNSEERLLVNITEDDGSSWCFESCPLDGEGKVNEGACTRDFTAFTRTGTSVLRYNPEKYSQCTAFQTFANTVKPAKVKLQLGRAGSESASQITIDVSTLAAFDAPSLFIGPIFAPIEGGESTALAYPQLWAVTNLKQIGSRSIELYLAEPSNVQQPIQRLPQVSFDAPGTKTIALNPKPKSLVLVAKENGEFVFVQGDAAKSKISGLTEYAQEFTSKTALAGSATGDLRSLLLSNTGFNPDVVKGILDKAVAKAKQSAFWRSDGSAWCKQTPACLNNKFKPFDECCRATREDWLNATVSFEETTEQCAFADETPAKFCNNLGFPQESGNWNSQTESCSAPIDFGSQSAPYCTQAGEFNPATQEYCDSRCAPRETVVGYDSEGEPITQITAGAEIAYGDSYRESFEATANSCSAAAAANQASMSDSGFQACKAKGFLCPVFTKIKSSVDTPLCVPSNAVDSSGLLFQTDEGDGPAWEYASLDDGEWKCPPQYVFAVANACFQEACTTYCNSYGAEGVAPRCDESGYCSPAGLRTVTKVVYNETDAGPLVEIPFASLEGAGTNSPLSSFPAEYARGFTYTLPVNTLIQPKDVGKFEDSFALAGLPLPSVCDSPGNFTYKGLLDLQSQLLKNQGGFYWNHAFAAFSIANNAYANVACAQGLSQGSTQSCALLFVDKRGNSDACIKSITQFEHFDDAPPAVDNKGGVSLSQMVYAGRLGQFKGTKQFAITPTGYVVALRWGSSTKQYFDWWNPDGSYGGTFKFTWSACTGLCQVWKFVKSVLKIAIIAGLIYLAINPAALGPGFSNLLSKSGLAVWKEGAVAAGFFGPGLPTLALTSLGKGLFIMAATNLYGQGLSIYSPDFNTKGCKTAGVSQGWNEAETQARLLGCKRSNWMVAGTVR